MKLPLRFDPKAGVYSATINGLPPSTTGTFKLQYAGDSNYSISPSFTLTMLPPNHVSKVISSDGKTEINVPPGALPKGTSLVIGPSPYPLPEARAGQRIVNGPIDISSSSTVSLKNFITLRLFGSATNTKDSTYKKTRVQVIHYNMKLKKWVPVDYRWIPEPIQRGDGSCAGAGQLCLN